MRGKIISGVLLFAVPIFSEIFIEGEQALIKHPGGIHSLMLSEVSFDEENRMFGIGNGPATRGHASSDNRQINLRNSMSSVKDQGQRGSCSAFAAIGLIEAHVDRNLDYSEQCLIIFHNRQDSSTTLDRLTFANASSQKLYLENECKYVDPANFSEWKKASEEKRKELVIVAKNSLPASILGLDLFNDWNRANPSDFFSFTLEDYPRSKISAVDFDDLSSPELIDHIRKHLLAHRPVGVSVLTPGDGWDSGMIDKMPTDKEINDNCTKIETGSKAKKKCGSHAIIFAGFDDARKLFFFKNSWGEKWGLTAEYKETDWIGEKIGYGAMSYEYFARFGINHLISLQ